MNCEEVQAQLSDYLDRSLGAGPMALVEEHLEACPPCLEETELLGECIRQVAALPVVQPPLGFSHRVMAHVREIDAQPGFWQRIYLALRQRIPVQATALVMLGVLGVYLLQKEETHKQLTALQSPQITDSIKQDSAPTLEAFPTPTTTSTSKAITTAKPRAAESAKQPASPPVPQLESAVRYERAHISESKVARSADSPPAAPALTVPGATPSTKTPIQERRTGAAQAAPEPSDRATPMISGTAVANHASSQAGGGSVSMSFPFESDSAFRSAPAAIVPFADYELVVRRHLRPPDEPRGDVALARRKAETSQAAAERPSTPRAIDRLMAAIPDHARPQTIWVTVPKIQYEEFKKELQALGTIESETRVPLLRDQTAAQADGQIRVKLTAMPGADSSTPNPPAGR